MSLSMYESFQNGEYIEEKKKFLWLQITFLVI